METVRADQFLADAYLDGLALYIEGEAESPFEVDAPDAVVERQDVGEELTENKLDGRYWGSMRSWHEGAGQKRLNVPGASTPFGFETSKGVDVFSEKGQATLLHETTLLAAAAYTTQRQKLAVASDELWMVKATATLRKFTTITDAGTDVTTGLAGDIRDLATDGTDLYACTGSNLYKVAGGGTSASTLSSDDVYVIEWAKDRLYAIRLNGTRYELCYYDSAGTVSTVYLFPANIVPNQMCELGPLLYISAVSTNSDKSFIYAYDGTNAPFVALPLPDGDTVWSMTPFLGAGMLVGCRRMRQTLADAGVLYVAFPQGAGHLVMLEREVVVLGKSDTNTARDYKIERGICFGRQVFFGWPYDDVGSALGETGSGLGVYFPESGGYASHLYGGVVGQVGGVARWRDRLWFTIQGSGLYREDATFLASGSIISSIIDVNLDVTKTWTKQETAFKGLPAATAVAHSYSTDGTTYSGGESNDTDDARLLTSARTTVASQIQIKATLQASGSRTATPTLHKMGIGGSPASKRQLSHRLLVKAFPQTKSRTGEKTDSWDAGWKLWSELISRRAAGTVLDYQPPWWIHDQTTVKVRVASCRTAGPWGEGGDRQGGLIELVLKEVAD